MKTISVLLFSLFASYSTGVFAWGEEGHAVVAIIAQKHLSVAANRNVTRLLSLEGSSQLSEIASWADTIRGTEPGLVSHAVRIPFEAEKYDPQRDCGGRGKCVVYGIEDSERVLSSKVSTDDERLRALKFLVHFVGDIHQPLHAIQETGQMSTITGNHHWTLHKVWDSIIIRSFNAPAEQIADELDSHGRLVAQKTPEDWAIESHDIAKNIIYHGNETLANSDTAIALDEHYFQNNAPVVKERLYSAGIRLATVLNQLLRHTDD